MPTSLTVFGASRTASSENVCAHASIFPCQSLHACQNQKSERIETQAGGLWSSTFEQWPRSMSRTAMRPNHPWSVQTTVDQLLPGSVVRSLLFLGGLSRGVFYALTDEDSLQ
jgi:hypothetical protein